VPLTTRVTVTRVLGLLKDEGWLQMDGQRHLVISHPGRNRADLEAELKAAVDP